MTVILMTRHCSVDKPSWAALTQFVRFLYLQLSDCQKSIFCNEDYFGEGSEFKKFVVQFMIRMSKVSILLYAKFIRAALL